MPRLAPALYDTELVVDFVPNKAPINVSGIDNFVPASITPTPTPTPVESVAATVEPERLTIRKPVVEIPSDVYIDSPKQDPSMALNLGSIFASGGSTAVGAGIGSVIPGLGTIAGGLVGGAFDLIGGLFSGPSEDRSLAGFNSYLNTVQRPDQYPPKDTLLALMQQAGMPADDIAAVRDTYSPISGLAQKGDWRIAVVSTSPVTLKWFKGASETFQRATNVAWAPTTSTPVNNQSPGLQTSVPQRSSGTQQQAQSAAFNSGSPSTTQGSNTGLIVGAIAIGIGIIGSILLLFAKRK